MEETIEMAFASIPKVDSDGNHVAWVSDGLVDLGLFTYRG